ncbi:hypothetical protein SSCG_01784 [Streptomyces clavuligerus]|nr:hypothetical protein SSCG_01784 [Streptomyces clavuligerus]
MAFRSEHGHGPSYARLCTGLGWELAAVRVGVLPLAVGRRL